MRFPTLMPQLPEAVYGSFDESGKAALSYVLEEPEQLLTAYFNASTAGLAIFDRELRFQAINPTLAAMNGLTVEAHLGKQLCEILGESAQEIEAALLRVLGTGQPSTNFELTLILPTRTEPGYWIENLFPIKDASGKTTRVGAMVVEITEQRKLEQANRDFAGRLVQLRDETLLLAKKLIESTVRARVADCWPTSEIESELVSTVEALEGNQILDAPGSFQGSDRKAGERDLLSFLTFREIEIFRLLAEGTSNKGVSSLLKISKRTVENHRAKIMDKLQLDSLGDLIRFAIRHEIIKA